MLTTGTKARCAFVPRSKQLVEQQPITSRPSQGFRHRQSADVAYSSAGRGPGVLGLFRLRPESPDLPAKLFLMVASRAKVSGHRAEDHLVNFLAMVRIGVGTVISQNADRDAAASGWATSVNVIAACRRLIEDVCRPSDRRLHKNVTGLARTIDRIKVAHPLSRPAYVFVSQQRECRACGRESR